MLKTVSSVDGDPCFWSFHFCFVLSSLLSILEDASWPIQLVSCSGVFQTMDEMVCVIFLPISHQLRSWFPETRCFMGTSYQSCSLHGISCAAALTHGLSIELIEIQVWHYQCLPPITTMPWHHLTTSYQHFNMRYFLTHFYRHCSPFQSTEKFQYT